MRKSIFATMLLILGSSDRAAHARPYATDDPDTLDAKSWQISVFAQGNTADSGESGAAVGLGVDYGLLQDLQVGVSLPLGSSAPNRANTDVGISVFEFGLKYRLVGAPQSDGLQISFCPSADFAFGATGHRVSKSATHFFFPVWAEDNWGNWTVWGGSGFRTNPGRDNRDSVFTGFGVTRMLTEKVQLGGEIYVETANTRGESAASGYNLGIACDLTDRLQLDLSAGSGLAHDSAVEGLNYFLSLEWTI